jgi:TPR repeat protein
MGSAPLAAQVSEVRSAAAQIVLDTSDVAIFLKGCATSKIGFNNFDVVWKRDATDLNLWTDGPAIRTLFETTLRELRAQRCPRGGDGVMVVTNYVARVHLVAESLEEQPQGPQSGDAWSEAPINTIMRRPDGSYEPSGFRSLAEVRADRRARSAARSGTAASTRPAPASVTIAPPPADAPPSPVTAFDRAELRALYDDKNAGTFEAQPLWFKDADGRVYVAGVQRDGNAFRIEWFDLDRYTAAVEPTREWVSAPQQTDAEARAIQSRFDALKAALTARHTGFRFVDANYSHTYYSLISYGLNAPPLDQLRQEALAAAGPSAAVIRAAAARRVNQQTAVRQRDQRDQLLTAGRAAADRGDAASSYQLYLLYERGNGVARDPKQALSWLQQSAAQGDGRANAELFRRYLRGAGGVTQDAKLAATALQKAVASGHPAGDAAMGEFRYAGGDYAAAAASFQRAADANDTRGMAGLARAFQFGRGKPLNQIEATNWYRRAAELGLDEAQYELCDRLKTGTGVTVNVRQAFTWCTAAAEQGYAEAQILTALMYHEGIGVIASGTSAVAWWEKAAAQDHPFALGRLAEAYATGDGVRLDMTMSRRLEQRAADFGDAQSQFSVAMRFERGDGLPVDEPQAFRYYTLAAEQGEFEAQAKLGAMYQTARGTSKDLVRAHFWLTLAARGAAAEGASFQHVLDQLTPMMTREQLTQSAQMVSQWKARTWAELKRTPDGAWLPSTTAP